MITVLSVTGGAGCDMTFMWHNIHHRSACSMSRGRIARSVHLAGMIRFVGVSMHCSRTAGSAWTGRSSAR